MPLLNVSLIRYVDDDHPGFVECQFTDANGEVHRFVEKVPVVTDEVVNSETTFPRPGAVACRVEAEHREDSGRMRLNICTDPWGIASQQGADRFVVLSEQITFDTCKS